uniref:Mitochondrial ATPase complex subunit ATP10 n=1 Tax=Ananas comosus var. bracteatus TaxID=296719 RepID=A0A6V7QJ31_ANACO|nr:unnamed protein product [Ananas comosus var. bracteatus]
MFRNGAVFSRSCSCSCSSRLVALYLCCGAGSGDDATAVGAPLFFQSRRCSAVPIAGEEAPRCRFQRREGSPSPSPSPSHALALARSFLDLHKMGSREAIEKEKTRLYDLFPSIAVPSRVIRFKLAPPRLFALNTRSDELSRGYFADISEIRQNGGKIALANKTIIPAAEAVNFPNLEVSVPDGRKLKLPASSGEKQTDTSEMPIPLASLLCLSFRASSQRMAESWSLPFMDAFSASGKIQIYEVSFIDSWLLSLGPVKHLFLKIMKKSSNPQRQIVYAFGDIYDFRKKLQILNLLTGYIFLVDRVGRIRWQGFGSATEEELSSLLSCTSLLLDDQ